MLIIVGYWSTFLYCLGNSLGFRIEKDSWHHLGWRSMKKKQVEKAVLVSCNQPYHENYFETLMIVVDCSKVMLSRGI